MMSEMTRLQPVASNRAEKTATNATGAACITYYDPYPPRTLETIKSCLAKGNPPLVRLHAAAEYPVDGDSGLARDQIDLEGHAVLIVGYNDETGKLALADPWAGGSHDPETVRWIPYSSLIVGAVDCSLGVIQTMGPPVVHYVIGDDQDGNPRLTLTAGFDLVPGRVMDRENFHISGVEASVQAADGARLAGDVRGQWYVGDVAELSFPLPTNCGDLNVAVSVTLSAQRPYPFSDVVSTKLVVRAAGKSVKLPLKLAA